jgi:hypothetical protein
LVQLRLRDGGIAPVQITTLQIKHTERHSDSRGHRVRSRFHKQDIASRVLAKPCRYHTPGGATANNDVIETSRWVLV